MNEQLSESSGEHSNLGLGSKSPKIWKNVTNLKENVQQKLDRTETTPQSKNINKPKIGTKRDFSRLSPNIVSPRVNRLRKNSLEEFLQDDLDFEKYQIYQIQTQNHFSKVLSLDLEGNSSCQSNTNTLSTSNNTSHSSINLPSTHHNQFQHNQSANSENTNNNTNINSSSNLPENLNQNNHLLGQPTSSISTFSSRCNSPTLISMPPSPLAAGKPSREFLSRASPSLYQDHHLHIRHHSSNSNSMDSNNLLLKDQVSDPITSDNKNNPSINSVGSNTQLMMSPSSLIINRSSLNSSPSFSLTGSNSFQQNYYDHQSSEYNTIEETETHIQTYRSLSQVTNYSGSNMSNMDNGAPSPITPQKKYITKSIRRSPAPQVQFKTSSLLSIDQNNLSSMDRGSAIKRKPSSLSTSTTSSSVLGLGPPQAKMLRKETTNIEGNNVMMEINSDSKCNSITNLPLAKKTNQVENWIRSTSNISHNIGIQRVESPLATDSRNSRDRVKRTVNSLQPLQIQPSNQNSTTTGGFSSPFSPFSIRSKSPTPSESSVGSSDLEVHRILKGQSNLTMQNSMHHHQVAQAQAQIRKQQNLLRKGQSPVKIGSSNVVKSSKFP